MIKKKRLAQWISVCLIIVVCSVVFSAMPALAKGKGKVSIPDFRFDDFGRVFKVKIKNKTKQTITITGKTTFRCETYKYLGSDYDELDVDDYDDDDFEEDYSTRTLKYKPKKAVKIKSGKTKWVSFKKTSPGLFLFEDESYAKITVSYKSKGKKKTVSCWSEIYVD